MRGGRLIGWQALPLLLVLGACSLAPADVRPAAPVSPAWPTGPAYPPVAPAAAIGWEEVFRDPRLRQLIGTALANSRDLRIAAANVAGARAQFRIQRAALLPTVGATAGYSYASRRATDGSTSGEDNYAVDLGTTAFEIDLFGRLRSQSRAAFERYLATEAGARAIRLALIGDIADLWLLHAADQSLLRIATETAAAAERSVALTRSRLRGGIAPRTDLRQAEQILAVARADVARQRTALAQDVNALELLVGAPVPAALLPGPVAEAAETLGEVPAGLDSAVLLRRPDVLAAEHDLRAANADIGAARAALFPRISLTSLVGFASTALSSLFDGDSFTWNVAPSAGYPIFRAGAGRAGVAAAQAGRDAALAAYERAIQSAFRDVADALARRGTIADELAATELQVSAAADTYDLATRRYRGGIDSFLASLDAERSLYAAQRSLVATQLSRGSNRVALYRALGGDPLLDPGAAPAAGAATGQSAVPGS